VVQVLRRRSVSILITMLLVGGLIIGAVAQIDDEYDATAILLAGQSQGLADLSSIQAINIATQSLSKLATDRVVMQAAIERNGLTGVTPSTLANATRTEVPQDTQKIMVIVRDKNARNAQRYATAIAGAFSDLVEKRAGKSSNLSAVVWQSASRPAAPSSPNKRIGAIVAFLAALTAGIVVGFTRDRIDTRWSDEQDIERTLGLPILGLIPTAGRRSR
jgi:capsular polysaccharide biosynthesis protein